MTLELLFVCGILTGLVGIIYANLNKKISDFSDMYSATQIDVSAIKTDIKWIKKKLEEE